MKKYFLFVFIVVFFIPQFRLLSQFKDCVSISQETQVLIKGSKSIFKCDIYYSKEKDAVVTHYYYPSEFIKMSNRFGEMKIYFPETNSVSVQQNMMFSTTNELLYYFINNNVSDLGLSKEGFTLVNSSREEGMMVTTWLAPSTLPGIYQVKIVFKEMLPIFAEYSDKKGDILKKLYYSKYTDYKAFRLPLRITEISFHSKTDSTISLSVFSNVRTDEFPENNYFNFKIPDDAKITK